MHSFLSVSSVQHTFGFRNEKPDENAHSKAEAGEYNIRSECQVKC